MNILNSEVQNNLRRCAELHLDVIGYPADSCGYDEAGKIRGWRPSKPSPQPADPAAPAGVYESVQNLHGKTL